MCDDKDCVTVMTKMVCEKKCVTKLRVTKWGRGRGGGKLEAEGEGTDLKTRTPHNFVGNIVSLERRLQCRRGPELEC